MNIIQINFHYDFRLYFCRLKIEKNIIWFYYCKKTHSWQEISATMALPGQSMLCQFMCVLLYWLIFSDHEFSPFMEKYQILFVMLADYLWSHSKY